MKPDKRFTSQIWPGGWQGFRRLFNPASSIITANIRLNGGKATSSKLSSPVERLQKEMALDGTSNLPWQTARLVNLEEHPEKELALDSNGWCNIIMTPKKILTIEFLAS